MELDATTQLDLDMIRKEVTTTKLLNIVTLSDLMAADFPPENWLVDRLIPKDAITVISGQPASFKTWVHLSLSKCVASGHPLFGEFKTTTCGVLIVSEEDGARQLQRRLRALQPEDDNLPIHLLMNSGFKLKPKSVTELIQYLKVHQIGLVIFDSLVRVHAADENSAGEMSAVFEQLRRFVVENITVIIIHHHRKQGPLQKESSQEMRGSSDILAAVDCHISVKKDQNQLTITQLKQREAQEIAPFTVIASWNDSALDLMYSGELDQIEDKQEQLKDAILTLLQSEARPMFIQETYDALKANGINGGLQAVKRMLAEMTKIGILIRTTGERNKILFSLPTETGLTLEDFQEVFPGSEPFNNASPIVTDVLKG